MEVFAGKVSIDRLGRLVVPKAARRELGLEPGVELDLRVEEGELRLRPRLEEAQLVSRDGLLVIVAGADGQLRDLVARERAEREREIAGRLGSER